MPTAPPDPPRPLTEPPPRPDVAGVAVSWSVPPRRAAAFREAHGAEVAPALRRAVADGRVVTVLPYRHRPVGVPGHGPATWSACTLVVGAPGARLDDLADTLVALAGAGRTGAAGTLCSVDLLALQANLDRPVPARGGGGRLVEWLEYVVSDPERRELYYAQQYAFSGPAMQRMHDRGQCARFVGFEVVERRFGTEGVAAWDVLHVSAFTPAQLLAMPWRFRAASREQARTAFGPGVDARTVTAAWDGLRTKAVRRATLLREQAVGADGPAAPATAG